jgi:lysozyme
MPQPLLFSQNCVDLVKRFEGCRLDAYQCDLGHGLKEAIWTIGYGHTRQVGQSDHLMDESTAERLLEIDLGLVAHAVNHALVVALSQNQFDALVAFCFNVKSWETSDLMRFVNRGEFAKAAEMWPIYCRAKGLVLRGLQLRREAEARLFTAPMPALPV